MNLITCSCAADSRTCAIHPVHRGRRFFLLGALALPVAAKLQVPEAIVPPVGGFPVTAVIPGTTYQLLMSTHMGPERNETVVYVNGREAARYQSPPCTWYSLAI